MIFYLGENVTRKVVSASVSKRKNSVKAWEYGYNTEFDFVCISKDGTLGDIYCVNGLNIGLPAIPDKKQIINHEVLPYQQKWKRKPLPPGLNEDTQDQDKFHEYIAEEFKRRDQGVYVYVNGVPVYITGTQYFFLQWYKLDEGYPVFRIIQNELMIYWEACKADNRCYGICYVKNRRFGWSSLCDNELLCAGIQTENALCGIISKTGADASSMFGRLIRAFKKLPCFFTPLWDGTSTPKRELNLAEPTTKRATKDGSKKKGAEEGLDTIIRYYSTALNSMDGERIFRSAIDECGKFPKDVPFDRYWDIVKTSHRVGSRIVGKAMVGSTMNRKEDGGQAFLNVYEDCNPLKRNRNGETPMGLYKLFIPARFCIEGFFDEYGFSITQDPVTPIRNEHGVMKDIGAITFLKNEGDAKRDKPETYYEFLRQFPDTEEHAFRNSADECAFDLGKIYEQTDYNEQELVPGTIQIGNFQWKDGVQDTEVEWRPNPNGRFYLTWHGMEEFRNQSDWVTLHGHRARMPKMGHIASLACDPYNRSQTVDGKGSLGSIHGQTKANMLGVPSEYFFLEYIDRPRTVELFFEDAIMACLYFSLPMLIELSNEKFLSVIRDRGYRWFSMDRPDKKWHDLSPTEKEYGGIPPQGKVLGDAQFYAVETFINDHVGVQNRITDENSGERKFGEVGQKVHFNRTLNQWKDVDPDKRTKFDAYISSSLVLVANQPKRKIKKTERKSLFSNPFSQFDNSGSISKRFV